jgi:hypothetical protein
MAGSPRERTDEPPGRKDGGPQSMRVAAFFCLAAGCIVPSFQWRRAGQLARARRTGNAPQRRQNRGEPMNESPHPEKTPVLVKPSDDSFGLWLHEEAKAAAPRRPVAPEPQGAAPQTASAGPDVLTLRAFRAGQVPLGSMTSVPGPGDETDARNAAAARKLRRTRFRPLDTPAAVTVALLAGLVVAGGYALRFDLRKLEALYGIQMHNKVIREHNQSRNILIRHLLKAEGGSVAPLTSYDGWSGRQSNQAVVVVTTPDGRSVIQTMSPMAASTSPPDGAAAEPAADDAPRRWAPPPLLAGYDDMRFGALETIGSRLPIVLGYVCAMAALIVWCTLAYRNLPALHAPAPSFRVRTVPLLWLLPPLNLFLPCAVMGEVWHGSDPRKLRRHAGLRLPIVGFWWPLILTALALAVMSVYRMVSAIGIDTMVVAGRTGLYADLTAIVVGMITMAVIAMATWNQSRRIKLVPSPRVASGEAWRSADLAGPPVGTGS